MKTDSFLKQIPSIYKNCGTLEVIIEWYGYNISNSTIRLYKRIYLGDEFIAKVPHYVLNKCAYCLLLSQANDTWKYN